MAGCNAVLAGLLEFIPVFLLLAVLSEDILLLLGLWFDCWSCMASNQVCYFVCPGLQGFLQIACVVGPLGAGLGCYYMQLYAALYVVLLEAGWNYGLLKLDFPSGLLP